MGMGRVLQVLSEFLDEDKLPQRNDEYDSSSDTSHLYNLIKDNEIDHFREYLASVYPYQQTLGQLRWAEDLSFVVNGKSYLVMGDNNLTALSLAVKSKSLACLKLIVERFRSKELFQCGDDWSINGYAFTTLLLPLLLKTKDLEALNFLLKQPSF